MAYYPIFLDLRGKRSLVVGGGSIGLRKAEGLIQAGADVMVISPSVIASFRSLIEGGGLTYVARAYREGDLKGFFLAFAATGDSGVDEAMAEEARREGVLLNTVDRPGLCDFITPAKVERGDLTIAISTHGQCPGFAKRVREKIEESIDVRFGAALGAAGAERKKLIANGLGPQHKRRRRIEQLLDEQWAALAEPEKKHDG